MFYAHRWRSGFLTGFLTGIAVYALAKTPRGKNVLGHLKGVSGILKEQVNIMSRQATNLIDGAVMVAEDLTNQEVVLEADKVI